MGFLRPIVIAAILALVGLAGNPQAEKLAKQAAAAEKSGEVVRAYLLWAQAASADRANPAYWARAEALRPRAEMQSAGALPASELKWPEAKPTVGSLVTSSFTTKDLDDLRRMAPPPRLRPSTLLRTFHLRGEVKALFEQVAKEFGYTVIFDKDYAPAEKVRFDVSDVGYREALHGLESATNSFIVPIADTAMLVAADTPQKRTELEYDEALAIPIPQRTSVQEAQELLALVQQVFEVRHAALDPQRRMILLRDRVSKVEAALATLNQLSAGKPQVSIEMEFLSTSASSSLSLGMTLPSEFPLVNFGGFLRSTPTILSGFTTFLKFGGGTTLFGIGLTNAELFATASRSSATSILRSVIQTSDSQAASFHVGNKYPIVTGGYLGSGGFSSGSTGTTSTYTVVSTTPYVSGASPVSTTGSMKLLVNSTAFPFTLTTAENNLYDLETVINSLGAGVTASLISRGTDAKPVTLAVAGSTTSVTSIELIDDPSGAAIELLMPTTFLSAISADLADATSTAVSATGTLSLAVGTNTYSLTLDADKNNLDGLRDAINAAGAGVTAAVLVSNLTSGSMYLQVVATASGSGTIQLYDDPAGTNTKLLTSTIQVNNSVISTTSTTSTSTLGSYTSTPTFNFEDLGLILKVTPFIHNSEEVTLDIEAEFKQLGSYTFNGMPSIANRKYQGKVRLKSGEWAVVAGLLSATNTETVSGIPGLKDIPGLGRLLRDNEKSREDDQILLVIKPFITTLSGSEYVGRPIWMGSETKPLSPL